MVHHIPNGNIQTTNVSVYSLNIFDTVYIGRGIQISSTQTTVILSSASENRIVIDGTVAGRSGIGYGTESNLLVGETGVIWAALSAVYATTGSSGSVLTNEGLIHGEGVGVSNVQSGLAQIDNSGTLRSGDYILNGVNAAIAYQIASAPAIIRNSGTIEALKPGSYSIYATGTLKMTITNSGDMIGTILLAGGNDTYSGASGRLLGKVLAGSGNDTITGGLDGNEFQGGLGNDTLIGNGGNDTLKGDAGADKLNGGIGKDILTGGADADSFIFTAKTHSVAGVNADRITDFDDGNQGDRINLSALYGPALQYIHAAAFTKAGQVRINDVPGADVVVEVNLTGVSGADFSIRLVGTTLASMTKTDFVL